MATHSVEIPEETFLKLERLAAELGFPSVDACVAFVLGAVVSEGADAVRPLTEDEEAEIRDRLADLGYL